MKQKSSVEARDCGTPERAKQDGGLVPVEKRFVGTHVSFAAVTARWTSLFEQMVEAGAIGSGADLERRKAAVDRLERLADKAGYWPRETASYEPRSNSTGEMDDGQAEAQTELRRVLRFVGQPASRLVESVVLWQQPVKNTPGLLLGLDRVAEWMDTQRCR